MAANLEIEKIKDSIFEDYKKFNEFGQEYWSARDFFKILDYQRWDGFINVIGKAKEACKNSNFNELDHFRRVAKMVDIGSGAQRIN
jgi:DNA-damage-inducible protein D